MTLLPSSTTRHPWNPLMAVASLDARRVAGVAGGGGGAVGPGAVGGGGSAVPAVVVAAAVTGAVEAVGSAAAATRGRVRPWPADDHIPVAPETAAASTTATTPAEAGTNHRRRTRWTPGSGPSCMLTEDRGR